jgi:subtilisin family serine protease
MIFISEGDKEKWKKAEASVSRILTTYPDSILAEVDEAQSKQLINEGFHLEPLTGKEQIKLRSIEFEPTIEVPSIPKAFSLSKAEEKAEAENYWIVQFIGPVKPEWVDSIRDLGGRVGDYVPDNAFLVWMTVDEKDKVSQLDFVRWIGPYQSAYKISPLLMGTRGKFNTRSLSDAKVSEEALKPTIMGNLRVLLHKNEDEEAVKQAVENLGGTIISTDKKVLRISLDASKVSELAAIKKVQWIEPYILRKLFNDVACKIIGVQPTWEKHGLNGEGQIVAVTDTGLDTGVNDASMHEDFKGRIVSIYSWPIPEGLYPYLNNNTWDDGASDKDSGHGTHVAGSVLGNGAQSEGRIRGMAFKAQLVFQAVEQYLKVKPEYANELPEGYYLVGLPDDLNALFMKPYSDGARIFSNSWGGVSDASGNPTYSQYTAESQGIDDFIWDHKDAIILFAAGNDGKDENRDGIIDADSLSVQSTAKNCITVGASENKRPHGSVPKPGYDFNYGSGSWLKDFPVEPISSDHLSDNEEGMAAFSSRGPTDDGRIKPDVVAPGTNILSVHSSVCNDNGWGSLLDNNHYMFMGGTSMATPITAGTVALIRQYLQRESIPNPSAALIKAILIHGAVPLAGQYTPPEVGAVPNRDEGWGRVNLEQSLFPSDPSKLEFHDSVEDAVGTGEQRNYAFSVINTSVPLRATLAWTDYPSTPMSGGLVNQLHLSITAPDGTTTPGGPENNNVQQVILNSPQMGIYTVRVSGLNIPTETIPEVNEKQGFALVVTGGL